MLVSFVRLHSGGFELTSAKADQMRCMDIFFDLSFEVYETKKPVHDHVKNLFLNGYSDKDILSNKFQQIQTCVSNG